MRLLLDTHVLLWWLAGEENLSPSARRQIRDPASWVQVSAASVWEISIKERAGKLDLGGADLLAEIEDCGFQNLAVSPEHALTAGRLPLHHDDPFDRMLIAQAQLENLVLMSRDRKLKEYSVEVLEV